MNVDSSDFHHGAASSIGAMEDGQLRPSILPIRVEVSHPSRIWTERVLHVKGRVLIESLVIRSLSKVAPIVQTAVIGIGICSPCEFCRSATGKKHSLIYHIVGWISVPAETVSEGVGIVLRGYRYVVEALTIQNAGRRTAQLKVLIRRTGRIRYCHRDSDRRAYIARSIASLSRQDMNSVRRCRRVPGHRIRARG